MALHKDFPKPPHAILDPDIRRFPVDEQLREQESLGTSLVLQFLSNPFRAVHDGKKVEDRGIERCSGPMKPQTETCRESGRAMPFEKKAREADQRRLL